MWRAKSVFEWSDIMSEHHIHVFSNSQQHNDNLDNNQSAYMDLLTQASSAIPGQESVLLSLIHLNTIHAQS